MPHLPLDEALAVNDEHSPNLVALDDALTTLEQLAPRKARVVELKFFGGLSIEETAAVLDISPITDRRDWTTAKVWLFRELTERANGSSPVGSAR